MSVEKTSESEHLFNDNKENDNVALDDINENERASKSDEVAAQKRPTMKELLIEKFSLSKTPGLFFDNVEQLKKFHEKCDNDDSFLQAKLPEALVSVRYHLIRSEYVLKVYDEQDGPSEELKEKLKDVINDEVSLAAINPTFLHTISSNCCGENLMKILQKHPELFQPLLNLTHKGKTALLSACENKNAEIAKCLVQCGADITIKDEKGKTAIYYAAKNNLPDVVEEMLTMCSEQGISKAEILKNKELYGDGHSIFFPALHSGNARLYDMLVSEEGGEEILRTEMGHKDFHVVMCYLCEAGCNEIIECVVHIDQTILSLTDDDGGTPLIWAARKNQLDTVKLILLSNKQLISVCDKSGRGVVYFSSPHFRVLEYLLVNFPECEVQTKLVSNPKQGLSLTALEEAVIKDYTESALALLRHGAYELFPKEQNGGKYNFFEHVQLMQATTLQAVLNFLEKNVDDYWRRHLGRANREFYPPLLAVALFGRDDLVNLLLDKGADAMQINFREDKTPTALHCAVESGSLSTVECLVRRRPDLLKLKTGDGTSALGLAVKNNKPAIVRHLLACGATYDRNEHILQKAMCYGDNQHDLVFEIISSLHKEEVKKEMEENMGIALSMQMLVKMYPKSALKLLDKCFANMFVMGYKLLSEDDNTEYLGYDFSFLLPDEDRRDIDRSTAIDEMVEFKRDECLAHPVVEKFIELKWNSLTMKKFYFTNLLIYLIFLICLTTHIIMQTNDPTTAASAGLKGISVIALIINSFNILKEIYQVKIIRPFRRYFHDVANFVEWIMYISSFVYFVPLSDKNHTQIAAGAIAVFLAWVNFTLFLKMFSPLGIYIIMAKKVLISILKVMPVILLFIVAFAVAFLALMKNDEGFNGFPISILTTFVMVIGEIDYRDVFLQDRNSSNQFFQRLFLVLIVVLCGIVLMNFLIGLAVDDTSKIIERSEAEKRMEKATAIKALETSLYSFYLKAPEIENPYYEMKEYKFSERVVRAQDDDSEDDKRPSTLTIDDLALRLDTLSRLVQEMADNSHSR